LQGGNEVVIDIITKQRKYFTWHVLFLCLHDDKLPDALRAKFCDLMIGVETVIITISTVISKV